MTEMKAISYTVILWGSDCDWFSMESIQTEYSCLLKMLNRPHLGKEQMDFLDSSVQCRDKILLSAMIAFFHQLSKLV